MSDLLSQSAAEGYQQTSLSMQKPLGEEFIQSDVCPRLADAILDLGCGTGELSASLAELVGPEGKVVGVDPDKERLKLARSSHSGIRNLSFVDGRESNISEIFPEAFDIIFSNYALHWIPEKQEAFTNMFASLKPGGKVAIQYVTHVPPFELNAYKELNPENAERICEMYQCESRAKIEQYCSSAGFDISKSYQPKPVKVAFENIENLLRWHWSTTHGVFDPSLVTEERLQRYLAPYTDKNGKCCLDFEGMKAEEEPFSRLTAYKPASL